MSRFKSSVRLFAVVLTLSLASTYTAAQTAAQEEDEGPQTQGDDAVYISVTFVDYKAGMRSDALEIIAEHFAPAGAASGTRGPLAIHFQTGSWDAAFHWRLEGGMADLEWFRSPDDVKWMEAMIAQEGSKEAVDELVASYLGMIARTRTDVGHRHIPEGEED